MILTIPALVVMLIWGRIASHRDWKPFAAMAAIALLLGLIGGLIDGSHEPLQLAASAVVHFGAMLLFFLQGIALRRWTGRAAPPAPAARQSAGRVEIDPGLLATLAKAGDEPGDTPRP